MAAPIWKIFLYIGIGLFILGFILYLVNHRNELMWLCFITFPFFLLFALIFWIATGTAHEVEKI